MQTNYIGVFIYYEESILKKISVNQTDIQNIRLFMKKKWFQVIQLGYKNFPFGVGYFTETLFWKLSRKLIIIYSQLTHQGI